MHERLAGVTQEVRLDLWLDKRVARRVSGPMLWTHFGVSGPAALDMSRHWLRAVIESRSPAITVNFRQGTPFDVEEGRWLDAARMQPRGTAQSIAGQALPASLTAVTARAGSRSEGSCRRCSVRRSMLRSSRQRSRSQIGCSANCRPSSSSIESSCGRACRRGMAGYVNAPCRKRASRAG